MMAKDKPKPNSRQARNLTTVMATREVARQLRTIADHRDEAMDETLGRVAGAVILKEYRKVVAEMHGQVIGGEG